MHFGKGTHLNLMPSGMKHLLLEIHGRQQQRSNERRRILPETGRCKAFWQGLDLLQRHQATAEVVRLKLHSCKGAGRGRRVNVLAAINFSEEFGNGLSFLLRRNKVALLIPKLDPLMSAFRC